MVEKLLRLISTAPASMACPMNMLQINKYRQQPLFLVEDEASSIQFNDILAFRDALWANTKYFMQEDLLGQYRVQEVYLRQYTLVLICDASAHQVEHAAYELPAHPSKNVILASPSKMQEYD